jgi:hypothetical protein
MLQLRTDGRPVLRGTTLREMQRVHCFSPADRVAMIAMINADDGEPRVFVEKAFECANDVMPVTDW